MTKAPSPYRGLPSQAFWRSAVTERPPDALPDLYHPRFLVTRENRVVTAGSCFSRRIGRALRENGFSVVDAEPLPAFVPDSLAEDYGFRLFSARYGNIYTVRQLLQLLLEARGQVTIAEPVWQRDGRYFDSQRPTIEPDGLDSPEAVLEHRAHHLQRVLHAFRQAEVFVFTLELTEAWCDRQTGTVYPTAPGTVAGSYDPDRHVLRNFTVAEIRQDFLRFRSVLQKLNPGVRFILTVSPVAMAATASGHPVEVANCHSKSVLRVVAGMLWDECEDVDYLPTYELVTAPAARGRYLAADLRQVSDEGVQAAMALFLRGQDPSGTWSVHSPVPARPVPSQPAEDDEHCDDALLQAFAP